MDANNLADAQALDPKEHYREKIQLFSDYCTEHTITDVPDPYYGGDDGFDKVMDIIEDGCRNLLKKRAGKSLE